MAGAPQILRAANALERETSAVEERLIERRAVAGEDPSVLPVRLETMLGSLNALVNSGSGAPTQAERTEFDELTAMLSADLREWDRAKRVDLAALNTLLGQSGRPALTLN
jgi:hypothetical protein